MLILDYSAAHKFMREQRHLGNKVRWEGWDMVFFKPTHYGYKDVNGAFRDGRWGVEKRVSVNADGNWEVSKKDVFTARKSRS
jgi:hypothetical protein